MTGEEERTSLKCGYSFFIQIDLKCDGRHFYRELEGGYFMFKYLNIIVKLHKHFHSGILTMTKSMDMNIIFCFGAW